MRAILTYHSIDASGSAISLEPAVFRRHLSWLERSGIRVVGIRELLSLPTDTDAAAITFDDGFENFSSEAWPALQEHGFGATLFVATDHVGRSNDWGSGGYEVPRLPLLDWPALGRLVEVGVTLGSHSASHRDLRAVSPADMEREIREPAERIAAETGTAPSNFAYPYGACDERVVAAVSSYYASAVTTKLAALTEESDPHRLPRIDAYYLRRPGRLESWGSGSFRRFLRLRERMRRARRLLLWK
jgi:peptidoglycan/xylan/chitin deacetylase (PgdA/CDA1 family)